MGQMHLKAKQKKVRYRSFKGEVGVVAPNVVDRNFRSDKPYQKMTTDVSQVTIKDTKMFFSPLLDMYNGEIVTYTI